MKRHWNDLGSVSRRFSTFSDRVPDFESFMIILIIAGRIIIDVDNDAMHVADEHFYNYCSVDLIIGRYCM